MLYHCAILTDQSLVNFYHFFLIPAAANKLEPVALELRGNALPLCYLDRPMTNFGHLLSQCQQQQVNSNPSPSDSKEVLYHCAILTTQSLINFCYLLSQCQQQQINPNP